jgi:hypothetical protein
MSTSKGVLTARSIADDVFGREAARELWSGNYTKVLPLSVQGFELGAILPAVFYMFRFGNRRGKGGFLETFGGGEGGPREKRRAATVDRIAATLSQQDNFEGFNNETGHAVLGDLLLSFCLENANRALGRKEQVQRVAPAHYMSCWLDLPDSVAHLRYVPEMIVAMLANQKGENVQLTQPGERTWFAVGRGFEENVLLRAFSAGVSREGELSSRTSDRFTEDSVVGLDQLLTIRLAQCVGAAPDKVRGSDGEKISNQRPISEKAASEFSEDIRRFVKSYATIIPRHALVELLESCIAVGLTTVLTSVVELLCEWVETGAIRQKREQMPAQLFVDCSNGIDKRLRSLAEQSLEDFMRRVERAPVILMALRLLDRWARFDPKIKNLGIPTKPYATEWLNMLGDLMYERRPEAAAIHYDLGRKAEELAARLEEDYPDAARALQDIQSEPNPVGRLAESLTSLQGRSNTQENLFKLLDSAFLVGRPNGLASKRTVIRHTSPTGGRKRSDARSLVLSDSVLDYLVHVQVLHSGGGSGTRVLALKDFLRTLRHRYGFCIDVSPPGMTISNDLLQANRLILERRLRDLGLLVGVNDAEAMKRLQPRFEPAGGDARDMD